MSLNWIDLKEYSFNSMLLLERFQISMMIGPSGLQNKSQEWRNNMRIALKANPTVQWYMEHRCPECIPNMAELMSGPQETANAEQIRSAEVYILSRIEDFVIYTTPEVMADRCDFIKGWDKKRLFGLADFDKKVVLDVGAGSGRLTFAAAPQAAFVYASEPVGKLREFMRDKIASEGIKNVRVTDGLVTDLPYPDDTFDIVMSGHVVGDDFDNEIAELTRVCKSGGWLLDCPGDSAGNMRPETELVARGWEEFHYIGSFGKDVYIYRKQIIK